MTRTESLSWLAFLFEAVGTYCVGNKQRYGFILNTTGVILWAAVGASVQLGGLMAISVVMTIIYVRNYIKWGE